MIHAGNNFMRFLDSKFPAYGIRRNSLWKHMVFRHFRSKKLTKLFSMQLLIKLQNILLKLSTDQKITKKKT